AVAPLIAAFEFWNVPKYWGLFAVRFTLGLTVVLAFCNFCRAINKHFGAETADFLRLIITTQFHFLFYASRPLPNTFALIGALIVFALWLDKDYSNAVRVATATAVIFRCELILLFAPIFLPLLLTGRLKWSTAIWNGLLSLTVALGVTVPLDSFLWGRALWPEGEVWWFNVVLNKSNEWGTMPFLWYFYSALPRALMASLVLVPIGLLLDRRLLEIVAPAVAFIAAFSFLPHKELRFIVYALPLINLAAAVACARAWINKHKSTVRMLVGVAFGAHLLVNLAASSFFLYASSQNYPGGEALGYLQYSQRFDKAKPISVHIDVYTAQTGVSRYLHLYKSWQYDKTEDLQPKDLAHFDFLLVGTGNNLTEEVEKYSATHRIMFRAPAYHKIQYKRFKHFPYVLPSVKAKERIAALKKL
uniref:Mannosyltransferase n=1 Tax=Plectus sambesii TaxID=2011161 RepID=A0A914WVK1_9BILA